ncbi:MAG: hypothetical protein L6R42_003518 [Xanthoria sp. 1 TBL-2021]|nr:MAG: hypothetical protein L6R42_003518 [Xanthoria sp. 1 TBL-2021]
MSLPVDNPDASDEKNQEYAATGWNYGDCTERGSLYSNWLATGQHLLTRHRRSHRWKRNFDRFYISDTNTPNPMRASIMAILSDDLKFYGLPGLDGPGYTFWAASSKDGMGIKSEEPAYENIINTRHGVIVALDNDRERDKARQQLNWSELVYQAWQVTKADDDKSGGTLATLKYSVQMSVINDQAVGVLELAYSNMGYPGPIFG